MFEQHPPLRVDHQPSLGADLVFQRSEPPVSEMLEALPTVPARPIGVPSGPDALTTLLLTARLDVIIAELRGLRQDLAQRTVAARLRRFWARIYTWLDTP